MRLTLKRYDRSITLDHERDDLTLPEMHEEMIAPLLLAMGYSESSVLGALYGPQGDESPEDAKLVGGTDGR